MFTVYSREGCTLCEDAKHLLKLNLIDFEEIVIGKDIQREQVLEKFPNAKMLPIILDTYGNEVPTDKLRTWITFELMRRRMVK